MSQLVLFTNQFPYKGGEPFLETEIHYLSKSFDQVIIYPLAGFENELLTIPDNVVVKKYNINQAVYLRKLLINHGWILVKWFILEFIKSPHRFKYITQFNWNFKRLAGLLNNAIFLKDKLKNSNYQYSIFYSYWFNEWASILILAKEIGLKGTFICRTHGFDFDEQQQGRGYHPFRHIELPKFDRVFQVSEYGQNYIQKQFPKSKNLQLAKLGVINHGFNPISSKQVFQIVSCSNFVPLKRVNLIVEILSHLSIPFHWIHFGESEGLNEVRDLANRKLPNNNFTFKGQVPNSYLMEWYKSNSVDLFINVSKLEGLPVSLMEAISFGIPIVGCNICGLPEIINQQTGILLEKDFNAQAVAETLEEFLIKNARSLGYREQVKAFWQTNFSAEKNYEKFISIIKTNVK